MYKYHHTRAKTVKNIDGNLTLEFLWTIIPTIIVMFMFYYGVVSFDYMRDVPDDAYEITATARKWSWTFTYPNGYQDTELTVPKGKPVKINIESEDVLHSFYIPDFRVKMDAVPGRTTYVWFNATQSGDYDLFCTEYCGDQHSYMLSKTHVVEEAEFGEWLVESERKMEEAKNSPIALGTQLYTSKGCIACHSTDGAQKIGPTFAGLFGKMETVIKGGAESTIEVTEDYLKNSIVNPGDEIVKGYETVPMTQIPLSDEELTALVEYIKSLQ